jgi:hypothetical protein
MLNKTVTQEESQAAPAMTPEMLAKLRKEDMRQAVVERFRRKMEKPATKAARGSGRSPYWRPADDEC